MTLLHRCVIRGASILIPLPVKAHKRAVWMEAHEQVAALYNSISGKADKGEAKPHLSRM